MNAITMTAMANLRKNKSRNILIGIAIFLMAFLLTVVPTIGVGTAILDFAIANKINPTFHAMYRGVSLQQTKELEKNSQFKTVGLRSDLAYLVCEEADINLIYCDDSVLDMNRNKLKSGRMPKKSDEIVVSEGLLAAMGINAVVGSQVTMPYRVISGDELGAQKEKTFTVTGMTKDTEVNQKNKMYTGFVSKEFMEEEVSKDLREYCAYVQMTDNESMTKDEVEAQIQAAASEHGIKESDVVINKTYLYSNYVDTELYVGITGIMLVILLAGIITIYSIYYVSMIDKVQEYGKLRAIGATRKQIRKLVFREGFVVAGIAGPVGVLAGALFGYGSLYLLMSGEVVDIDTRGRVYIDAANEILKNHEVAIVKPWILAVALIVVFLAVYFSLLKPMKTASRISPVEAIRFNGEAKSKKSDRKGYQELNVRKLTISNLSRNRKRTFITILTLACTGIFLIAIASVINCMDPEVMAREEVYGDFQVSLDTSRGDKMHPEREKYLIQQSNPLNQELEDTILNIEGVTSLEKRYDLDASLWEVQDEGENSHTSVTGVNEKSLDEMKKYIIDGKFTVKDLEQEDQILMTNGWVRQVGQPKLGAGDQIHLEVQDGEKVIMKAFTIAAVVDSPRGLTGYADFVISDKMMSAMFRSDSTYAFNIMADPDKVPDVTEKLEDIVEQNEFLTMKTYQEELKNGENAILLYGGACYALLVIFGLIGILNLVNTMINSVYARRRELGMLQAIGLSDRQLLKMLQMEGMYYTVGTMILSLTLGNLAGYAAFQYGKSTGMFAIRIYQYPTMPTVILVLVIIVVQLLLTRLLAKDLKKQSLVDRIRFAD